MKNIDVIYIPCCKTDFHLTRICVASIRYWYPKIPITLLLDFQRGCFSTHEIEKALDVRVMVSSERFAGWGFSKFEVMFQNQDERMLILDSDIVFAGKVLDALGNFHEEFVVVGELSDNPRDPWIKENCYDFDLIREFDSTFEFPGYGFNGGQILATGGKICLSDFEPLIEWKKPPTCKKSFLDTFSRFGDQGVFNYVLARLAQDQRIDVKFFDFMTWHAHAKALNFPLRSIVNRTGEPFLIHWAGPKPSTIRRMNRHDLLQYYEDFYYSRVRFGSFLKRTRNLNSQILEFKAKIRQKLGLVKIRRLIKRLRSD